MTPTYFYIILSIIFAFIITGIYLMQYTNNNTTATVLVGIGIGLFFFVECSIIVKYYIEKWDSDSLFDPDGNGESSESV